MLTVRLLACSFLALASSAAPRVARQDASTVAKAKAPTDAELASFSAFLQGALSGSGGDAFARVDLDRVVEEATASLTIDAAGRAALRAEAERRARALLAPGTTASLASGDGVLSFLRADEHGLVDELTLEIERAKDGSLRIVDLWPARRLAWTSSSLFWKAIAAGAVPAEELGLEKDALESFRALERSLATAPASAERSKQDLVSAWSSVAEEYLVGEHFLADAKGGHALGKDAAATLDLELVKLSGVPGIRRGLALVRFDRALAAGDVDEAFDRYARLHDEIAGSDERSVRAFAAFLRGRAWLAAKDAALATEAFDLAVAYEPAFDPAWRALLEPALARGDDAVLDLLSRWSGLRPSSLPDVERDARFASFLRSPQGARWKERKSAKSDSAPSPNELLDFAFDLESALRSGDAKRLYAVVDLRRALEIATADVDVPEAFARAFRNAALSTMKGFPDLVKSVESGATFDFLRMRERAGKPSALYRFLLPNGGVEYLEFLVDRREKGLVAVDWYTYASGARLSEILRETYLPIAAEENKGALLKLFGDASPVAASMDAIGAMVKSNQKGEFAKTLETFAVLPEEAKALRGTLRLRLIAAQNLGGDAYESALVDMEKRLASDPSFDFVMLDRNFLRKRFDLVDTNVAHIDASVGGDPHWDRFRASTHLAREQYAESEAAALRAMRRGLDLQDLHWYVLTCRLRTGRYEEALGWMMDMTERYDIEWNDLSKEETYAGFVASPAHERWLAFLEMRAARSAEDEEPK